MTVSLRQKYINADGTVTQEGYNLLRQFERAGQTTASVPAPTGGATVDTEARAAIAAIIAAHS
jgi:hypothetical protein